MRKALDGIAKNRAYFYHALDIIVDIQALFFRAEMKQGVIIVPPLNSEEILR
jgi:hypothetical protein